MYVFLIWSLQTNKLMKMRDIFSICDVYEVYSIQWTLFFHKETQLVIEKVLKGALANQASIMKVVVIPKILFIIGQLVVVVVDS